MPNFFDQLDIFGQLESSTPDPVAGIPSHLRWLKDSIAGASRQNDLIDDLFSQDNSRLDTTEYGQKVVQRMQENELKQEQEGMNLQLENAVVKLNADAMLNQINQVRLAMGDLPLLPDKAELKDPNNAQALVAALGSLLFPQFAFDIAASPFQNQLNEQAKEQARLDQGHAEQLRRAGIDADLAIAAGQAEQRVHEMNVQAQNRANEIQGERNFILNRDQIQFQNALTMSASEFSQQKEVLNINQKHQLGMFFLSNALDPNVGPEVRASAHAKLADMGIEIDPIQGSSAAGAVASSLGVSADQLKGMTIQELNHFVGLSLALKDERRKADLFPEQKKQLENQGKLLEKEVQWKDRMLKMQWDLGQISIKNTQSEIDNRSWMQSYNTEEQQRARIGMIGTMYQGSIDALKLQIVTNSETIEANSKVLGDALASEEAKKIAQEQNTRLINANETLMGQLGELNGQYLKLADDLRSQTGLDVQGTNNGESFLGTPYAWGGGSSTGPSKGIGKGSDQVGFDCSGFTKAVANLDYGITIPRTAEAQWRESKTMTTVSDGDARIEDARMGDFLYFRDGNSWHTGILVYKDGIAHIRHAPQTGAVVRDDLLSDFFKTTKKRFVGIKRVYKPDPYTIVPKGALQGGN